MGFPFYAVKVGKEPGIYTSWVHCKAQVDGVSNAIFKGFRSREAALRWLHTRDEMAAETFAPRGSDHLFTPMTEFVPKRELSTHAGPVYFGESSKPGAGVQRGAWQAEDFLYVENMEMLLARLCSSLGVGHPLFYRRETTDPDNGPQVGFAVVLPANPLGLAITAEGELSTSEADAREDAAFRGIEGVLNATGKKILDYNYRVVMRVQRQLQDLRRQSACRDLDRIYQLERENAILKAQIALFNDMLI
ncbi:uncharacterized protein LOC130958135 [Arachis stenosperma]|uniref:uncharacterized protein LOC130958135 n=1 Tax=Arachis stenosperma TaxID=217475 RepID=UPI0025AC2D4F|nr:uncharacterized protein LOC130958135 [Arachis stenosperma]